MTDTTTVARATPEVRLYAALTGIVLLLLMLFGVLMRLAQSEWLAMGPDRFYQMMTAHGIGMVAIATLGGSAVLWHFLGQHVALRRGAAIANLAFFLAGVAVVLWSIFAGGFAGAWTFLYPLPSHPMGMWTRGAAAGYLVGVLLVGVGMLVFFLETTRAILQRYGSFAVALGWKMLRSGDKRDAPPAAVLAGTVVSIANLLAVLAGAAILTMMLINLYLPQFAISALLAKNLIYFFGHVAINATIYMAVIAVYEILPRYTGHPWGVYRAFVLAWNATLLMVLVVYPHHLLMDFAMPLWAVIMGQVISYTSSLPVLAVTLVGTLANIHRSGIRWDLTSGLLVLSIFGWSAGVVPAVIDGTIAINQVMHNTLWVPGHFHFYLLIGCVAMILAFINWLSHGQAPARFGVMQGGLFWLYALSALGFVLMFLYSGHASVPRRFAVHLPEWQGYDRIASGFALLVLTAVTLIVLPAVLRIAGGGRGSGARPAGT